MIKILDSSFNRLGVIKNAINASRLEEINGENILDFEAILDSKMSTLIGETTIFELDGQQFDIAYFKNSANEDGTYTNEVQSEHISYRLNKEEYNIEYFTELGTPTYILGKILEGTGFSVGTVDFSTTVTYSAQQAMSRRQLLMEFIAYLEGEVIFDNFTVSIVSHRGSTDPKPALKDRNVKLVAKSVNKRRLDELGNPEVSYICKPVYLPEDTYALGDDILLINKNLGVQEALRVVRISYNPYNMMDSVFEFSKYVDGLASSLYQITTQAVVKDALYNGARIGPEFGFESVRNDKLARAYFRSDGFAFQSGDGTGENWVDRLYYEYDAETDETVLVFDGKLTAGAIEAISATIDVTISNTIVTQNLYASMGDIADLTVNRLETSDKVDRYKATPQDTSRMDFIRIEGKEFKFIEATVKMSGETPLTEPLVSPNGDAMYWTDETETVMTVEVTDYPVTVFQYDEVDKLKLFYEDDGLGNYVPKIVMGVGSGEGLDYGKGFIYKGVDGLYIEYRHSSTGEPFIFKLTDDGLDLSQFENVSFNENVYLTHRGINLVQNADYANAEGDTTKALGLASHAEGWRTVAVGNYSHAEGKSSRAEGDQTHAEGQQTVASGMSAHAEGSFCYAAGDAAHAEGGGTFAVPYYCGNDGELPHARATTRPTKTEQGYSIVLDSVALFEEGDDVIIDGALFEIFSITGNTVEVWNRNFPDHIIYDMLPYVYLREVDNKYMHAEGDATIASGNAAHAEGYYTRAYGNFSHAQNRRTTAVGMAQTVIGKFNVPQGNPRTISPTDHAFIVGNGEYEELSNALALDWSGNLDIAGEYRANGVAISNVALGETEDTAYRGDRGKIAYDHSQAAHASTAAQKNSDITKEEIEAKLTGVIASHTHAGGSSYAPLTNGNIETPELLFYDGDVILVEVL